MQTPYYVFDADEFINNYIELQTAFRSIYDNYQIAYSFKTNYTPAVCKTVLELGGYAEVVSDMEYELAKRIGFSPEHIVYNGPGKKNFFAECVKSGGLLNLDNLMEVEKACQISTRPLSVGIRVNFDIGNALHSRFGIDAYSGDLEKAITQLNDACVSVKGLHFHISRSRGIEFWKKRIETTLEIADWVEEKQNKNLEYIDLGSGMFGKLDDQLKEQFVNVPTYSEYATVVAGAMADHYATRSIKPMLITEPGTTLVSKYFSLYSTVLDIKTIRGKHFALLDCSYHNVGEICGLKKVPLTVVKHADTEQLCESIDLVGYTCLEQDVISRDFFGALGYGSIIEFKNVGGYSIVDKPPFIHPDIPIYMNKSGKQTCIKRAQTIDDIFAPYVF